MELGMIGLGRMGGNMAKRLLRGGHSIVGYARHPEAVERIAGEGGSGADSIRGLVGKLKPPRNVWLMVPSGDSVDHVIGELAPLLDVNDAVIDGGNSNYRDTIRRAAELGRRKLNMLDVGTSGGIWGLTEGYSMMIGGDGGIVDRLTPVFQTLAPAPEKGWGHVGPNGAGHFVKMVHNGIEYGLMQAYAEGFSLMRHKRDFDLNLHGIAAIWSHGSVVRSWLLDLISESLAEDPEFEDVAPFVADSGEGRWTVQEALDLDVPAPVITLSLIQRFRSRDEESYPDRFLAALRNKFGGHPVKRGNR